MPEEIDILAETDTQMVERMNAMGNILQARVNTEVMRKSQLEQRWLEDLRQANGEYDPQTKARITQAGGSTVFMNLTRQRTVQIISRVIDKLLPTDDRNWGILATPDPDMASKKGDKNPLVEDGQEAVTDQGIPIQNFEMARAVDEIAAEKAEGMQRKIYDQLTEGKFNAVCRKVISDGCWLGTGILKGPVITGAQTRKWVSFVNDEGEIEHDIEVSPDKLPRPESVDPWDFYPDSSATSLEDAEFVFQRHRLTKKKLRKLAKVPKFNKKNIAFLLMTGPNRTSSTYVTEMREMSGITDTDDTRYEVWEYNGEIEGKDLKACGCDLDEDEELRAYDATIWFSQGLVLKATISILEVGEALYNTWTWEKDETSIFGFGVPRLMRHNQSVINGAWRMTMDNAGLGTGPQIIINRSLVDPADGAWGLAPNKLWYLKDDSRSVNEVFGLFDISMHLNELANILTLAYTRLDDEINMPSIAGGQQGSSTRTSTGLSILMNQADIALKNAIKRWDDNITVPFITRMYDFNMRFAKEDEIKGDFKVDARGASILLAKELQAANLMRMLEISANPLIEPMVNMPALIKEIAQSLQVESRKILRSDEEIEQRQQQLSEAQQGDQSDQGKLQLEAQRLEIESQLKKFSIEIEKQKVQLQEQKMLSDRELTLASLAAKENTNIAAMRTKLGVEKLRSNTTQQLADDEANLKRELSPGHFPG